MFGLRWSSVGAVLFWLGCQPAPQTPVRNITVTSPVAGRITIGESTQMVRADETARFSGLSTPYSLTLSTSDDRITLAGVDVDAVDLGALFGSEPGIPGGLKEVTLRPQPSSPTGMVMVVDRHLYSATKIGELWIFEVPAKKKGRVIAYWADIAGQQQLGIRQIAAPVDLEGSAVTIAPNLALDREIPIFVQDAPAGWLTAELVYDRIRTGIVLAEGLVTSRRARSIPSHVDGNQYELSLWIDVQHRSGVDSDSQASITAALPFYRSSVALDWTLKPSVTPPLRELDEEVPLLEDTPFVWGQVAQDAQWLDIELEGLGRCAPLSWRILGPASALDRLPDLDAGDPRRSPLMRVKVSSVNRIGWSWSQFLSRGSLGLESPEFISFEGRRSVSGYWIPSGSECTEEHEYRGRYTLYSMDECVFAAPKPVYWINGCGDQILLKSTDDHQEVCGRFFEEGFRSLDSKRLAVTRVGGQIQVGATDGFVLVPSTQNPVTVPDFLAGLWMSYETTEFDVERQEDDSLVPVNEPVLIAVGDPLGGPWMDVSRDGRVKLDTQFLKFEGWLFEEGEDLVITLEGAGCPGQSRHLRIEREGETVVLTETLAGSKPDISHVRRYRFSRGY